MAFTLLRRGRLIPVPPVEKAQRFLAEEERLGRPAPERRSILGTGESVRDELVELAREYGAEEVIVVTIPHEHEPRRRSYELLADAFGLRGAGDAGVRAAA
jgi:alkanesulfonate monooxygenase SsuD/methylene tetrahydromethanopterin reductase-like flavin-dependent oxidoreductase (luciferase family)